jgi:hypothetical protein
MKLRIIGVLFLALSALLWYELFHTEREVFVSLLGPAGPVLLLIIAIGLPISGVLLAFGNNNWVERRRRR